MTTFQENLNEAMEKTQSDGIETPEEPTPKKNGIKRKKKQKIEFSFKTFSIGGATCLALMAAMIGWAFLNAQETNIKILESLPSKTAIVETLEDGDTTTLTMSITEAPRSPAGHESSIKQKEEKTKTILENSTASPIMENSRYGILPRIDTQSGAKPYRVYQAPFKKQTDKPLISFIITDLGLSTKKTEDIVKSFPPEISLSFSSYARDLDKQTDSARQDGHEFWLTLPLQVKQYPLNDPGPSTLLVNASTNKNEARLHATLGSTIGYVGLISPPNHVFKIEDSNVNPTIKEIFERGLAVIDSNLSGQSFIARIADRQDYPHARATLWLDDDLSPQALLDSMRKITEHGNNSKNLIVMLQPYPTSLKAVQKFLKSSTADKFELAPASAQLINN